MNLEKIIAATFEEMAQGLETGSFGRRPKIALTGMGSEHGVGLILRADSHTVHYDGKNRSRSFLEILRFYQLICHSISSSFLINLIFGGWMPRPKFHFYYFNTFLL